MPRVRFSGWVGLALALLACEKPSAPGSTAVQAAGGSPAVAASTSASAVTAPVAADTPPVAAAADTTLSDAEAHTSVRGCLASASGMPVRSVPSARANDAPPVEIISLPKPKIVHHLTHACCLQLHTHVKRAGSTLTLVEELSGTPCRCQCASTLSTELSLPPGRYDLRVETVQSGATTPAFHGNFEVATAGAAAPAASAPRPPKAIHVPAAAH